MKYNPPPGWPKPPDGWVPPKGWKPDPAWPTAPEGWELWISNGPGKKSSAKELKDTNLGSSPSQRESGEYKLDFDDATILQEAGIYQYHHPLENSVEFKVELKSVELQQTTIIRDGRAIEVSQDFAYENSVAKGRKLSSDLSKLMLRAYNAEAENCIRTIRAGNINTVKRRLERTLQAIGRLGKIMQMQISDDYHALKLKELELTSDFF